MRQQANLTGFEIAITGMAGRFPGAKNIEEFWENLVNGKETITFFTDEELLEAGIPPKTLANPNYVKANGILADTEYFDSSFFGYTDSEAALMDPQIRIFHECAWSGLEDAGYCPHTYNGLIGLYVGASSNFDWEALALFSQEVEILGLFSSQLLMNKDFIGGWVSYKLNLKGPAFTLATGCSTSLVAIHGACQAILNGECDMALAGGVSITYLSKTGYMYMEGLPASRDGHVRAFDAGPHGVVSGNGAAVVVLKRLEDALEDRDHIYAVIKGSAINNDGMHKVGFTAPSIEGQVRVIKTALAMAEVAPESIGYIETHGTATELGDPVEIQALSLAYNTDKRHYCRIGSVKTNIGHLDSAAGVAGLIKAALAIAHGLIPPSLNFKRPNPKIDFENSPFYVNAQLSEWQDENNPRRAGVSSWGIGGTNAHIILEEAPAVAQAVAPALAASTQGRAYQLLLLSAKTGGALARMTQNLARHLEKNPGLNLADAAYTLQTGRKAFPYRRTVVCSTPGEAVRSLLTDEEENPQIHLANNEKPSLVFMFSGQGSQYVNMGLDLYNQEPRFREEADNCFRILRSISGIDFKEILYPAPGDIEIAQKKINDILYSGPTTLLLEYSLAKLLMSWGLKPDAMIGHSFGEYTAACLAGVFAIEDVLKLALLRGELMHRMPEGAMMSVSIPEEELKRLLPGDLDIAAVNGPATCIVSGLAAPMNRFEQELKANGQECLRFNVFVAGHSQVMAPFKKEFEAYFEGITLNTPEIPYISGLTGVWITRQQATSAAYWVRHMTETIRFYDGIGYLIRELNPIFVQVGPDRGLPLYVNLHPLKTEENIVMNMVRYKKENDPDVGFLLTKIGELWKSGVNVDWESFYVGEKNHRIALPTYSFERNAYPPMGNIRQIIANLLAGKSIEMLTQPAHQDNGVTQESAAGSAPSATSAPSVKPKRKRPELSSKYAPAGDESEQKLVEIFQTFFAIEPVGIHDDFYQLGGDSLRAVQLANVIKKANIGLHVSIQQLLLYQNIHEICRGLKKEGKIAAAENKESTGALPGTLALKDQISPEDRQFMEEELSQTNRLGQLLKNNTMAREYEVSPIQRAFLVPPYEIAKTNFVYYYTDFSYPINIEDIRGFFAALLEQNSLLRSMISERGGNHFIREYEAFTNFRLIELDISTYDGACREQIIKHITGYLNQPMEVLENPLFRAVVLKTAPTQWRLILLISHVIGDGSCIGILDKQFHAFRQGMTETTATVPGDYHDYVQFMKDRDYSRIGLDKYLDLHDYSRANEAILKNYTITELKYESFEADISQIAGPFKEYYNEIALFAFANLIGALFGVDNVPIEYVTNGRIYKDAQFNHIIGDFHDNIPVLFSLADDPLSAIERFSAYKHFVKENNLNFMNYVLKGYITGWSFAQLKTPFSFNSLIGTYDFLKETEKELQEKRVETIKLTTPHFGMLLLEDFSTDKLWVSLTHNSGFSLKGTFQKKYFQLINCLNKKNKV